MSCEKPPFELKTSKNVLPVPEKATEASGEDCRKIQHWSADMGTEQQLISAGYETTAGMRKVRLVYPRLL